MSEVLQMSNKEETVEVIDFRNNHIRDLFSENLPDVALQKLKIWIENKIFLVTAGLLSFLQFQTKMILIF